jgi:hypothetical protein
VCFVCFVEKRFSGFGCRRRHCWVFRGTRFSSGVIISELPAPYDLTRYTRIWECPPATVDRRHLFWMYDVLCGGRFQHALEIGCLNGASSTAFVEAINGQRLRHATFCDIDLRATLQEVLKECRFPDRIQTFEGRSVDLLRQRSDFDFVFVDGDHRLESVTEEVELLLLNPPTCVMAHDTSVRVTGLDSCEGPAYLKWRLQTAGPYRCLEENTRRSDEEIWRGMFFATTSDEVFERARQALEKWGENRMRGTLNNEQFRTGGMKRGQVQHCSALRLLVWLNRIFDWLRRGGITCRSR